MVNRLVCAVTGQPDVASAWRSLIAPNDRVGIKISAAGGELFTTHRDIVNAIVSGLVAAGHARANIIVWDKSLGGIKEAGYTSGEGYQLKSIPPRDGYDPKAVVSAPFLGNLIWGDYEYIGNRGEMPLLSDTENTSSVSHLANIVAHDVTKIINVPVLSDNVRNGIAGCLYNVTIPNVDNWRRFGERPDFGASSIPDIYADPHIGPKVVFNLMDGLLAQYAGGPESQPGYAFPFATLYASKDPVAIDAIALRQLEEWRKRRKLPPIETPRRPRHGGGAIWPRKRQSLPDPDPRRRPVKAILKSVSRSFYLTIKFLPRPLREPVSLAYLLARATDTIADTAAIPATTRLTTLRSSCQRHRRRTGFRRSRGTAARFRSATERPARTRLDRALARLHPLARRAGPGRSRRYSSGPEDDRAGTGTRSDALRRSGFAHVAPNRGRTGRVHLSRRRLRRRVLDQTRLSANRRRLRTAHLTG